MAKKIGRQGPEDLNQAAFRIVQQMTGDAPRDPVAESDLSIIRAEAGRKGGIKGGAARAAKLTTAERSAQAKKAADKRWAKE